MIWSRARVQPHLSALAASTSSFVAALVLSGLLIAALGESPIDGFKALFQGGFGGRSQAAGTLNKAVPLLLVSLGWIVAFSAGRVNIGLEGQIIAGGIAATIAGTALGEMPGVIHLPITVAAGVLAGSCWAGLAAFLWARRGVSEMISTLLLNFVAIQLLAWAVAGPLQEPTRTLLQSEPIDESARWPALLANTPLSWDIALALLLMVAVFLLPRTRFGFNLRLVGSNARAASYAGVTSQRTGAVALIISGGLAGLAGSSLLLGGDISNLFGGFSANYGFVGIVVALLARNQPLAALPAAILIAFLLQGGVSMQGAVGISSSLVLITQGLVIVFVAISDRLLSRSWFSLPGWVGRPETTTSEIP